MSSTALRSPARLLLVLVAAVALLAGLSTGPAAPAAEAKSISAKALDSAASRKGMPYVYGAAGPTKFDCSGLVQWSFKQAGKNLPRTAAQQRSATQKISKGSLRNGDLIFFHNSSGRVYHVGIYAGNWQMWDAPKPGRTVTKRTIWTQTGLSYGRV